VSMEDAMLHLNFWTTETLLCTMLFTVFHWPCATTILTVHKETGETKKTAAAVLLPTAVGVCICLLLHFLLGYLGG